MSKETKNMETGGKMGFGLGHLMIALVMGAVIGIVGMTVGGNLGKGFLLFQGERTPAVQSTPDLTTITQRLDALSQEIVQLRESTVDIEKAKELSPDTSVLACVGDYTESCLIGVNLGSSLLNVEEAISKLSDPSSTFVGENGAISEEERAAGVALLEDTRDKLAVLRIAQDEGQFASDEDNLRVTEVIRTFANSIAISTDSGNYDVLYSSADIINSNYATSEVFPDVQW